MTTSDDTLLSLAELASTLRAYEGPDHPLPSPQRLRRRRRPTLALVGVAAAVFGIGGVAAAEGIGPFAGIGAADHPVTTSDTLDPAIVAKIDQLNSGPEKDTSAGQLLPDTARLVTTLDSGRRIYVIATTTGDFCVLDRDAPGPGSNWGFACSPPLSEGQPTTIETTQANEQTPPLTFGVASDNVAAVSFEADGTVKTIPITNNVWVYEGVSNALQSLTVHFRDGSETVLEHG